MNEPLIAGLFHPGSDVRELCVCLRTGLLCKTKPTRSPLTHICKLHLIRFHGNAYKCELDAGYTPHMFGHRFCIWPFVPLAGWRDSVRPGSKADWLTWDATSTEIEVCILKLASLDSLKSKLVWLVNCWLEFYIYLSVGTVDVKCLGCRGKKFPDFS